LHVLKSYSTNQIN